jgi:hypothetical protein
MAFLSYTPTDGEIKSQRLSDGCIYDYAWNAATSTWDLVGGPRDCVDTSGGGGTGVEVTPIEIARPTFVCQGDPYYSDPRWAKNNEGSFVLDMAPGAPVCLSTAPPKIEWPLTEPVYNSAIGQWTSIIGFATYTSLDVPPTVPTTPPLAGSVYIQTQFDTNASANLDTVLNATRTSAYTLSTPFKGVVTLAGSVVTYNPNPTATGADSFQFTYQAVKNSQSYTLTGTVFVNILPPPPPATPEPTASIVATPSTIAVGSAATLSWNAGSSATVAYILPSVGNVGINGSVVVSPAATTNYTITAQSSTGVQTTATAAVTVIPVADPPVAVNLGVNCAFQQPVFIPMVFTGQVSSAAIATQPANGAAIGINLFTIRYTPNPNFSGIDTFTYAVTGPGGTSTATVTVSVQPFVCPPPTISLVTSGSQPVPYNTATLIQFQLTGTVDSVYKITNPQQGSLSSATVVNDKASIVYTPNSNFLGGSDSFQIAAEGPCGQSPLLTVPLTVGTPPAPTALSTTLAVAFDTATEFFFTYNGFANKVVQISGPSFGTIVKTSVPFKYVYTPNVGYSGSDTIVFRVEGSGGVSADTGSILITVAAPPAIARPEPISFINLLNQPSNITVLGSSATFTGSFLPNYSVSLWCESDSYTTGSQGQQLTSLYAVGFRRIRAGVTETLGNTGVPVQLNDVFIPIVKTATAVVGTSRTLRFRVRVSGNAQDPGYQRDTFFDVVTAPADLEPSAFDFQNQTNLEVSSTVTTNSVLITGMTPDIPVPARVVGSGNPVLIVNSGSGEVVTGSSTTVQNNWSLKVRATTPALFSTTTNYTVTVGDPSTPISDSFSLSTRNPNVTEPPWNFGNRANLELNTAYVTPNTVNFIGLETAATISVNNSANVVVNGSDTLSSSATINNGDAVALKGVTANQFNTNRTFTVTLTAGPVVRTDTFVFGTRVKDTVPAIVGNFIDLTYQQLNTVVNSGNVVINDFDETSVVSLVTADSTAQLVINGNLSGNSATITSGTTVSISATTANDYYARRTYTITCGGQVKSWSTLTKSNDDQNLLNVF